MKKDLKNIKKNTKWSVTEEEIKVIMDRLGDKVSNKDKFGVKNYLVLKEIAKNKIKIEAEKESQNIIGDYMVYGEGAVASSRIFNDEGNIYYNVVLTENKVMIYALDYKYNLIEKRLFNINELRKIKRSEKNPLNPYDELVMIVRGEYFILMGIDEVSAFNCNKLFCDLKPIVESVNIPLINRLPNCVA